MTNPIYYPNHSIPSYSGVTINITNPSLNTAPIHTTCPVNCSNHNPMQTNLHVQPQPGINDYNSLAQYPPMVPIEQNAQLQNIPQYNIQQEHQVTNPDLPTQQAENYKSNEISSKEEAIKEIQSYPPQYYLNDYNNIQRDAKDVAEAPVSENKPVRQSIAPNNIIDSKYNIPSQEEDMSTSENIKNNLDARLAEQKELEKNGTKTKVVALTNEYIMSLENYLNNPNTEIRLMASKEILTRLDEDKERYDDAALNALLNKMLQDPEKLIRIAALSAFSSQLASGNEFTFELLNNIQNDPNADKEDVVQAADCLLKMSSSTETKITPAEKQQVTTEQIKTQAE